MTNSGTKMETRRRRSGQFSLSQKLRKPRETDLLQQRLPVWNPMLTPINTAPFFFGFSVISALLGLLLNSTSRNIVEFEIDYTGTDPLSPCYSCAKNYSRTSTTLCTCSVAFTLDKAFKGNVYMYYGLSNFFQNHRRYLKSRDDAQLNGEPWALKNPSSRCEPYQRDGGLPIAPCGAISNSLFNDTLRLYRVDSTGTKTEVSLVKKDIAWWTDKHLKFKNPPGNKNLSLLFEGTNQPPNWRKPVYELDPSDPGNNGFMNEDLIVWMRPAMSANFRKLYRIIPGLDNRPTLPQGAYVLDVAYNFPVISFGGRKRMILSTMSWMGGKNPFLGLAYITMGVVLFLLAVIFLMVHLVCGTSSRFLEVPHTAAA
ncbi:cell cycle control protein 50A-like isoform X1 [Synchiropus splendidus]|uniref:cell cycle control protein 50A-like isoform X1 n=1 Tax=Synchiropus splendidus TaxID=270530 RepID=UPI00237E7ABF|nr:cell cycle control protein 50A-like isoform X1 [Synchiropus splendidus]